MKSWSLALVVAAVAVAGVNSQRLGFGPCPKPAVVTNFGVTSYTGNWYEQQRYVFFFDTSAVTCTKTDLRMAQLQGPLEFVYTVKTAGTEVPLKGTATFKGSQTEGRLLVGLPSVGNIDYWILDTDNTNYSVAWTCYDFFIINIQMLWLQTRAAQPTQSAIDSYRTKIKNLGMDLTPLQNTNKNCAA